MGKKTLDFSVFWVYNIDTEREREVQVMIKYLVFDMDGTIADLYGVENWLAMLRAEDSTPYAIAKPLYDMDTLNTLLTELKAFGYRVVVTTWLANGSSNAYSKEVARVKKEWLDKWGFPYDRYYPVAYGTPKQNVTRGKAEYQILFDDNDDVRAEWDLGYSVDAKGNILKALADLLVDLVENA